MHVWFKETHWSVHMHLPLAATLLTPENTPRFFSTTTATSPMIFHQHHSKWGHVCWSNLWFASSSSYQPADLTSPSQQRPPSLQEVVQPAAPAKWRNHRRVKPQVVKAAKSTEKIQDEKTKGYLEDWPGRVFGNCWTLTSFEDCWGIRILEVSLLVSNCNYDSQLDLLGVHQDRCIEARLIAVPLMCRVDNKVNSRDW